MESYNQVLPHVLPAGTVLKDRYELIRLLGAGGFGITYLATDRSLGHTVAVKEYFVAGCMYRNCSDGPEVYLAVTNPTVKRVCEEGRARFSQEARLLARTRDLPGIVEVFDFFEENRTAYLVMEYLPGPTLASQIELEGPMDLPEVLEKLTPVMESLETLHKAGAIHRDISPDNLIVISEGPRKGSLILFDFGGWKHVDADEAEDEENAPKSAILMKKDGYTPIEQTIAGRQQGPWTDVYSLTATIYFCLTGKVPADADERFITERELVTPDQFGAQLNRAQVAVIEKGMALCPSERYQSMAELEEAFELAATAKDRGITGYRIALGIAAVVAAGGAVAYLLGAG